MAENQALITEYLLNNGCIKNNTNIRIKDLFSIVFYFVDNDDCDNIYDTQYIIDRIFNMNSDEKIIASVVILADLQNDLTINATVGIVAGIKINANIRCYTALVDESIIPYLNKFDAAVYQFITRIPEDILCDNVNRIFIRDTSFLPTKKLSDVFPNIISLILSYGNYESDELLMTVFLHPHKILRINTEHVSFDSLNIKNDTKSKYIIIDNNKIVNKLVYTNTDNKYITINNNKLMYVGM
jgi:hypothetical protein